MFETQKLKLVVTLLTMFIAIDGLLKVSANATLMYYFQDTKFVYYLAGRIVVGAALTIWTYFGLAVIFYDYVLGIILFSCGILVMTVGDIATLVYKLYLTDSSWTSILDSDDFSMTMSEGNFNAAQRLLTVEMFKEDSLEELVNWLFLCSQISVFFTGLCMAQRLKKHKEEEHTYAANLQRLYDLRRENQLQ